MGKFLVLQQIMFLHTLNDILQPNTPQDQTPFDARLYFEFHNPNLKF